MVNERALIRVGRPEAEGQLVPEARREHYASMASGGVLRHCGIGYDFLYFESTDPSYKEDTE